MEGSKSLTFKIQSMLSHPLFVQATVPNAVLNKRLCASNANLDTTCLKVLATKVAVLTLAILSLIVEIKYFSFAYNATILAKHARGLYQISAQRAVLITFVDKFIIGFQTLVSVYVLLE